MRYYKEKEVFKIIRFKVDIVEELKKKGITYTSIKENKVFAAGTMKKFKDGNMSLNLEVIEKLCDILGKDVGEILENVENKNK